MSSKSRKVRSRETEKAFAGYLRHKTSWQFAREKGASEAGEDIENTPGVDFELKATRDMPLLAALRQAEKRSDGLHVVVWRPDGYGVQNINDWVLAMRVKQGVQLLGKAGYW